MVGDPFAAMDTRLREILSPEAFSSAAIATLRGSVICKPIMECGVEQIGENGQVVGYRDVAGIASALLPEIGNTLSIAGGKSYIIDGIQASDGLNTRCVLRLA